MRALALSVSAAAAALALLATPAAAQVGGGTPPVGPNSSRTEVLGNPSDIGIVATTPSRIGSSRREMNRGRDTPFEVNMSARETRRHARDLLGRADIQCEVSEAEIVAYTEDYTPLVEVDCVEGGGLVIADTLPIQAMDCLDIPPPQEGETGFILACTLPGNVAVVNAARQSARN